MCFGYLAGFDDHTKLVDLMIAATSDMYHQTHSAIQFFTNASVQFAIKCNTILWPRILVNGIAVQHSYRM